VTFAREGAQVFCVDRNGAAAEETVNIIKSEGGKATAFTADVSRAAEVEAMVAACLKAFRPHRRARQQCRHRRDGRRGRGVRGGMGPRLRRESEERRSSP
jgi:NAD(P)-dependent dehydrogenase (short-subunit alcohol dehydrogenase family)